MTRKAWLGLDGAVRVGWVLGVLAGMSLGLPAVAEPLAPAPATARGSTAPLLVPPTPAAAPWQQGVRYRIEARLDESTDVLSGRARIRYRNASPDTLTEFYVHQHLNAFRPNSAWARRDLEHGIRTFQELGPGEHAFERIRQASVDGRAVEPFYPHAPDSTIAGFRLPRPLLPGDSIAVEIGWDARLSTVPRRQGRRGRSFDFAQWYPRVVVYDLEGWRAHPLYRQGEFYGEFATYDVTLQVARDQVLGATGVPLEGDPGWAAAAAPGGGDPDLRRDWYAGAGPPPCVTRDGERVCGVMPSEAAMEGPGRAQPLGLLEGGPPAGSKRVRWYAEDVHHFAWSTSPEYVYEEGRHGDVTIRVLYRPGDEEGWGGGVAARRTAVALEWLEEIFGPYPYPQITNLHRIEGGGTEFPMVIMDGSPSLGLILHEMGHQYAHGILGNNEWYEGWLDEGMSSFQTSWFYERRGAGPDVWTGAEARVLHLDLLGKSEPVVYPAEDYPEYGVYGSMIYTKGSLILRMLRDLAGDEAMKQVLRAYYERYRFRHVDSERFRAVAEEVLGRDLGWFFGQWLHATGAVDYALEDVEVEPLAGGGARTRFRVERRGEMRMPVPVRLTGPDGETRDTTVSGTDPFATTELVTPFRPERVEVDPDGRVLDWNGTNDVWGPGLFAGGGVERSWLRPLDAPGGRRDRMAAGFTPLAWANDAGGVVAGFQRRTSYMGRFHRSLLRVGLPAVEALDRGGEARGADWGSLYYRVQDPVVRDRLRPGRSLELFVGEGRAFASGAWERDVSPLPLSGPRRSVRAFATVATVYDPSYLIPDRWGVDEGTTVEWGLGARTVRGGVGASVELDVAGAFGLTTRDERYLRGSLEATWEKAPRGGWGRSLRLFVGASTGTVGDGVWTPGAVPPERRFGVSGDGPWATLSDPWSRSRGALLEAEAHHPGEGGLRGFDRTLMADRVVAGGFELRTPRAGLGPLELALVGFVEGGWVSELVREERPPDLPDAPPGDIVVSIVDDAVPLDAGAGLELSWSDSPLALRVDVPFLVGEHMFARSETDEGLALRWAISVVRK